MSEPTLTPGAPGAPGRVILITDGLLFDTPFLARQASTIPLAIINAWADNTLAHIDDKFIPGWETVLESFDTFHTHLVTPAIAGYRDFLTPDRLSRHERHTADATRLHGVNLAASYEKLRSAIEILTTSGRPDFEQRIRDGREAYRDGETAPLGLTGDAIERLWGAAVRQWWWLSGNLKLNTFKLATDVMEATFPVEPPFLLPGHRQGQAFSLVRRLIQGGCFFFSHLAMEQVHARLDEFLTGALAIDYAPPPFSSIRFLTVEGTPTIRSLIIPAGSI